MYANNLLNIIGDELLLKTPMTVKYRESLARIKTSKILIICKKNPFGELSSKTIFPTFKNLLFSRK